jgi:hypothetical protein
MMMMMMGTTEINKKIPVKINGNGFQFVSGRLATVIKTLK